MTDPLRRAQASQREIAARLAIETDPEMCAWLEKVMEQWTIEIANLKRSRSLWRRILHTRVRWSRNSRRRSQPAPTRKILMVFTLARAWLAGKKS